MIQQEDILYGVISVSGPPVETGGGGEPSQYLKDASVSNRTLTITKKNDSTVTFTDTGSIVSGTNDGENWNTLTIDGVTKNIPNGGSSGEPAAYLKSASTSGNTLTLTKKDNTTVVYTPNVGTIVSGTNDGTNWTTITIEGTTKSIPSGGGSGEPAQYLKSAAVMGNTLTIANKNDSLVQYTPTFTIPNADSVTVGGLKVRISGNDLYITNDGTNP